MEKRDGFTSKFGFILACIGSAVGMGNIWRFPWLVSSYGGLCFLIPYILFVLLISNTGIIEEFALGRASGGGPTVAFRWAAEQKGKPRLGYVLGHIPVLGSFALGIGYTVVMAWIIKYTCLAFSGNLYAMGQDMDIIGATFGVTADSWGANLWIVIAIIFTIVIMAFGIANGIERANKIMMPLLFVLFVALGIYIAFLPGSSDGYKYIFTLNPSGLLDPWVWIYAFGQAFFSLSVGGNGSVVYGAYLSKNEDIPFCARNVAIFDTLAAFLAALVIIPAMATTGEQLSSGGPGLMFIYLVNVFNGMPGGKLVGIIFFVCVLFAGLSSLINIYEAPVSFVQNRFKASRPVATFCTLIVGAGIALCIQHITSQWMDVVSIYFVPLGALLAGIMFFWFVKKDAILQEVNRYAKRPRGDKFYFLGKYIFVFITLFVLIVGAALGGIG